MGGGNEKGGCVVKSDCDFRGIASRSGREIVGSESYAAALITRLKKENYISVRNAGGYKGYVLRGKGKRYLLERYEDDLSFFLSGSAQTNHVKSEPEKRLRLYRMSEVWVFFYEDGY